MDFVADVRLTDGPVLWAAWILGAAAALYLTWPSPSLSTRRSLVNLVSSVIAGAVVVALVHWALIDYFSTFPENIPLEVLTWCVPAVAALVLMLLRLPRSSWRQRSLGLVAFVLVALLCTVQVNAYFGLNRTVSDLMGTAVARISTLEPALTHQPGAAAAVPLNGWQPGSELPKEGALRKANIPGTASGLSTRDAYLYLPPAYFAANRPALPVLLLFSGQPGGPADWLSGGALRAHMDDFAAAHGGVAPVVVVADPNGSQQANTLCMDSRIAHADTYLSKDVPAWIATTLDVSPDHRLGPWADFPLAQPVHSRWVPGIRTFTVLYWRFRANWNQPLPRSGRRPSTPHSRGTRPPLIADALGRDGKVAFRFQRSLLRGRRA